MKYTLAVVDMQYHFDTATEELTIQGCAEQIKIAIKNKNPIVFVEYEGLGETLEELTNLTKKYNNTFFVEKSRDDGSRELRQVIREENLPEKIRICGVNFECCVFDTARSLTQNHEITLIATAVNSWLGLRQLPQAFDMYGKKCKKIKIIHRTKMLKKIKQKLAA